MELVAEDETGERPPCPLPFLRKHFEADVLGEKEPTKCGASRQKFVIGQFRRIILVRGDYIHTQAPELACDG